MRSFLGPTPVPPSTRSSPRTVCGAETTTTATTNIYNYSTPRRTAGLTATQRRWITRSHARAGVISRRCASCMAGRCLGTPAAPKEWSGAAGEVRRPVDVILRFKLSPQLLILLSHNPRWTPRPIKTSFRRLLIVNSRGTERLCCLYCLVYEFRQGCGIYIDWGPPRGSLWLTTGCMAFCVLVISASSGSAQSALACTWGKGQCPISSNTGFD